MVQKYNVIFYTSQTGNNPVSEFIDNLDPKQQVKVIRILKYIDEFGLQSVIPHVRKLSGYKLWEIRILGKDNIRIIYAIYVANKILLLHGFMKKTQKTSSSDIEKALVRLNEWIGRHLDK